MVIEAIGPLKVSQHDEPLAYGNTVHYSFSPATVEYVKVVLKCDRDREVYVHLSMAHSDSISNCTIFIIN
jgi:hypothetical protein